MIRLEVGSEEGSQRIFMRKEVKFRSDWRVDGDGGRRGAERERGACDLRASITKHPKIRHGRSGAYFYSCILFPYP